MSQWNEELITFLQSAPSMFHSVAALSHMAQEAGFEKIAEQDVWKIKKGCKYYTTRNASSFIAFTVGENLEQLHFQLAAAHSDSPTFKLKTMAEMGGPGETIRLNVEPYGGMIDATWFDRPLSVAGRVFLRKENQIVSQLLYIDQDILMIPNVAIHLLRDTNTGHTFNKQIDLIPLFSAGELKAGDFDRMLADELGVLQEDIVSKDLFLVNRQKPIIWGYKKEFVSSPRLDDMQCGFSAMKALTQSSNSQAVNVCTVFDNEEVGSNTKQGAMSTFLVDTLKRINKALGGTEEEYYQAIAKSFLVSCDNAHAVHPNHPELYDSGNRAYLNQGVVIKEAANQRYTTDAFSRAVFMEICKREGIPLQLFANRSDKVGGSTLGNLSNIQVSMHALDIGIAQLAMHSSYETCGAKDTAYLIDALRAFYETNIRLDGADGFILEK